jgi:hypothetical protein
MATATPNKLDPEIRRGIAIINAMAYAMATRDCTMVKKYYLKANQFMLQHISPHVRPEDVREWPPSDLVLHYCHDLNLEARIYAYWRFKQDMYHFMMRYLHYSYNLNELQYDYVKNEILSWVKGLQIQPTPTQ